MWQPRDGRGLAIRAADGDSCRIRRIQRPVTGSIVDMIAANPPYINTYQGGLLGQAGGLEICAGVPNSAGGRHIEANQAFLNGFPARPSGRARRRPPTGRPV